MSEHRLPEQPDRPWVMRTYAGHSDARRSNELYRRNLAKGQTGLSVAFDLPTQTGYDPDHVLARGEVGKVGVSIAHKGDMHALLRRHPARRDEHVDDDQRDRGLAARPLRHRRRRERRRARRAQGHDPERHHQGVPLARHLRLPAGALDAADRRHGRLHASTRSRAGTRPTSAATTCRRPGRRRCRRSPTRSRPRSPSSTRSRRAARSPRRTSRRSSAGSRSSSTPASASSRSTRSCARWARSGSGSGASATASPTRSSCACATASRSTRSG